jgi:hypothetical protein
MANTYELIEAKTLTSSASTVTFSSIPQTYTDLKLVISDRNDRTAAVNDSVRLVFNGVTTGYTAKRLYGNGSTIGEDTYDTIADNSSTSTADTFSNIEYYIPNYTSSNHKSYVGDGVMEQIGSLGYQMFIANLWSNTAAITSVQVKLDTATNYLSGSSFYLYGIKKS